METHKKRLDLAQDSDSAHFSVQHFQNEGHKLSNFNLKSNPKIEKLFLSPAKERLKNISSYTYSAIGTNGRWRYASSKERL